MDSLIETLANPTTPIPSGKTRMDAWAETLPPERQEAVLNAARNPAWRHTDLLEVLKSNGAPDISDTAFGSWRRKKGLPRVS